MLNSILAICTILFIIGILSYMGAKRHFEKRRIAKLRRIKEALIPLISAKASGNPMQEPLLTQHISAHTYLDVATNRDREEVFFNRAQQNFFEQQFISQANIKQCQANAERSINKWHRIEALLALGYARIDSSLQMLKDNLFNKDEDISYFSALALCQMRNMDSARALLQYLRNNRDDRHKITIMLGQFPSEIYSEVIKLSHDKDPSLQVCALRIIESIGTLARTDTIEDMLKDESPEVRAAACQCLGVVGNINTAKIIKYYLDDAVCSVRVQALIAIDKLLKEECVELVVKMIKDNSWLVIDSLKKILAKHINVAISYLEKTFIEEDMLARRIAVEIVELSGYTEKLYAALLEGGTHKARAIIILEGMIKTGAFNGLQHALHKYSEDQNYIIIEALREIDCNTAARLATRIRQ